MLRRIEQYAQKMTEHEFFTHASAAAIWGIPLPPMALQGRGVDVAVFTPRRNPAGAGVNGHAVKPGHAHVVVHPELTVRVASPASTWAMLGAVLRHPYDLVAAADAVLRESMHPTDPPPLATSAQLAAALNAGRRVGIARLRDALPRTCPRSDSRPETWLRLTIIDAGNPVPAANHEVFHRGVWIARVDLAYPELRIAIEYEGEHHLDPEQWSRDIARIERLVEAGWRVLRVTKADVFTNPAPFLARLRRAIAVAG